MSREAVIKLINTADKNYELGKKISNANSPEIVIEIAAQIGYQFTEAELLEVMQEKQLSFNLNEELSEEQLETVVGGKGDKKAVNEYYAHKYTS